MFESLIFCETSQHVRQAISNLTIGAISHDLVALTPEAAWECQLRGQPYLKIEDFYNEADLSTHAEEVFKDEVRWANWVDEFLQQQIPALSQAKFSAASAWFTQLQSLFDGFFESAYALTHFLERARPREVFYWTWEHVEHSSHLWHKKPIHSTLLPILAPLYGALPRQMSADHARDATPVLRSNQQEQEQQYHPEESLGYLVGKLRSAGRVARSLLARSRMWREIKLLRSAGLGKYFRSMVKQSMSPERVLVVGNGYDLDPLILALRERSVQVTWLHNVSLTGDRAVPSGTVPAGTANLQHELVRLWPVVIQQEEFWAPLAKWGVGRNDRAESALSFWWHKVIPELWQGYQSALKAISRRRYLAAVAWEAGGTLCGAMLQAAGAHSIPRLIYQHGSTARIRIGYFYPYLLHSERFLVYGNGTAEHLQRNLPPCEDAQAEVVPVGSARLDALKGRMNLRRVEALRSKLHGDDHRPIILYAPTFMGIWGKGLSDETGYADVAYFEMQERIMRLFADFPGVRLLYKDVPSVTVWNPIPDLIRREIPNGRAALVPPLAELVWAADAIILDHMITALGEALLTRKRIVVYDPGLPGHTLEPPEAKALLRKRAVVAETPDGFVEAVRTFLIANDFTEINVPNDEFLRAYGTHLNDGRSAQRAVDEILTAARISSGQKR